MYIPYSISSHILSQHPIKWHRYTTANIGLSVRCDRLSAFLYTGCARGGQQGRGGGVGLVRGARIRFVHFAAPPISRLIARRGHAVSGSGVDARKEGG